MNYDQLKNQFRDGQPVGSGPYPEIIRFIPSLKWVGVLKPDETGNGKFKWRTKENLQASFATGLPGMSNVFYQWLAADADIGSLPFTTVAFVAATPPALDPAEYTYGKIITGANYLANFGVPTGNKPGSLTLEELAMIAVTKNAKTVKVAAAQKTPYAGFLAALRSFGIPV